MSHASYSSRFGMWVFLGTEILFFGALFVALYINYFLAPLDFKAALRHMDVFFGSMNTFVLLTSSWTMAMALYFVGQGKKKKAFFLFMTTVLLGFLFLVIKSTEYFEHGREHMIPALDWNPNPALPRAAVLFFFLYFVMTLLHALHLTIGLGLISVFGWRYSREKSPENLHPTLENLGLYWHFVDLVWIFLFPSLYLIGRT